MLFVANSAGILPWDALMVAHAVERLHPSKRRPRPLVADWLATLPFSQSRLARMGAVRACAENAERLLLADQWVIAFPEGQKGSLKPFRERYRLQRFARGGFVPLAARLRAAIVPVAIVGAEETYPVLFEPRALRRLLGVPVPITPTFPLLGPLGHHPAAESVADPLRRADLVRRRDSGAAPGSALRQSHARAGARRDPGAA